MRHEDFQLQLQVGMIFQTRDPCAYQISKFNSNSTSHQVFEPISVEIHAAYKQWMCAWCVRVIKDT